MPFKYNVNIVGVAAVLMAITILLSGCPGPVYECKETLPPCPPPANVDMNTTWSCPDQNNVQYQCQAVMKYAN